MNEDVQYFTQKSGLKTAFRHSVGRDNELPTLVFLPGYMSDMDGGKACAIFDDARENGHACLLLDYSGCGKSEGNFSDGSLSLWCEEICALIADRVNGPLVLIGSSMGGWLMLMVAMTLPREILHGVIGIAAAPDFTHWGIGDDEKRIIARDGVVYEDNPYGPEPTPTYKKFFDVGQANLLLGREIAIDCPVRLFHGQNDEDVPYEISLRLASALRSSDVHIHLIKDGDHRFSREKDIAMLITEIHKLIG